MGDRIPCTDPEACKETFSLTAEGAATVAEVGIEGLKLTPKLVVETLGTAGVMASEVV